jgi:hypothetical protein
MKSFHSPIQDSAERDGVEEGHGRCEDVSQHGIVKEDAGADAADRDGHGGAQNGDSLSDAHEGIDTEIDFGRELNLRLVLGVNSMIRGTLLKNIITN